VATSICRGTVHVCVKASGGEKQDWTTNRGPLRAHETFGSFLNGLRYRSVCSFRGPSARPTRNFKPLYQEEHQPATCDKQLRKPFRAVHSDPFDPLEVV